MIHGETKYTDPLPPGKIVAFPEEQLEGWKYVLVKLDTPVRYYAAPFRFYLPPWHIPIEYALIAIEAENDQLELFAEHKDVWLEARKRDPREFKDVATAYYLVCVVHLIPDKGRLQEYIDRKNNNLGIYQASAQIVWL